MRRRRRGLLAILLAFYTWPELVRWLFGRHPLLDGRMAWQLLLTRSGRRHLRQLLQAMEDGAYL